MTTRDSRARDASRKLDDILVRVRDHLSDVEVLGTRIRPRVREELQGRLREMLDGADELAEALGFDLEDDDAPGDSGDE